jgi:hypothetical protein
VTFENLFPASPGSRRALSLASVALALTVLAVACGPESARDADFSLRWPAPRLERPEVIDVGADGRVPRLAPGRDYRIVLRRTVRAVGGLSLIGGRNVVVEGGHITIPPAGPQATGGDRRGLLIEGQTGTVHVEGLLIDNAGGDLSEGINIAAPRAIVQIQNTRVAGVHARDETGFTDNHPDVIQTYGGVRELRVNRLTGTTTYQGLFLRGDSAPVGRVELSKVNIVGSSTASYLLWKRCNAPYPAPCQGPDFPIGVTDVWVRPAPGRSLRLSLKPEPPGGPWDGVHEGIPPGGDFVTRADLRERYPIADDGAGDP